MAGSRYCAGAPWTVTGSAMGIVRVAVVERHDIFRLGLVGCLARDPSVEVVFAGSSGPVPEQVDVAIVSWQAASDERFSCPLLVCDENLDSRRPPPGNQVMAILPRGKLAEAQLLAATRAAAVGLHVDLTPSPPVAGAELSPRSLMILRLLSSGADTRQISESVHYSERTMKCEIQRIERAFGVRNRSQAVAEAIRRGLIFLALILTFLAPLPIGF
jgi:DNA-binding CsgD family transcriptional regulator